MAIYLFLLFEENQMKIASISDLHLCTDEYPDSFQHNTNEFLHFLDHLEDNYDKIILNGDIYDPCKNIRFNEHLSELYKIQDKHQILVDRFNQDKYLHIAGNHDSVLTELGHPLEFNYEEEDGDKYFFAHGHEFDFIRGEGILFIVLTWLVNQLDKFGFKNAEAYLSWLEEKVTSLVNLGSTSLLKSKVKELLTHSDKRYLVSMGHSHEKPKKVEFGNNIYLNSGACVRRRLEYVHIDTIEKDYYPQSWSETNIFGIATKTNYQFYLNN